MAGITGIYCADGRPVDMAALRVMAEAARHRAPDGITYWSHERVGFAHLQFHTTPESLDERQPLTSPGGEVCLVWNGRLDNREELLAALADIDARPIDATDPGYALAAYLAWGPECLGRMIGDFALAIWDARARKLWCARDYLGIRPFYYFWDGRTFLFGPDVRTLLAHPLPSLAVNEGMIGEYMANEITNREETLYRDIRRLPSGSTLTIDSAGSLKISAWWKPELSLLRYKSDEEYAEHFRELMTTSVRARMRAHGGWVSTLSGGLDSSTISVTAQHILNEQGHGARVPTLSFTSPGKDWDESGYIREIAAFAGLETDMIQAPTPDLDFFKHQAALWRDLSTQPNGISPQIVPFVSRPQGHARVLLMGIGGNEWLDGSPPCPSALLRLAARGRFGQAREEWRIHYGDRHLLRWLARQWLRPAVPGWALRRKRARWFAEHSIFSDAFLSRTSLADRIYSAPKHGGRGRSDLRFALPDQQEVFYRVTNGLEVFVLEGNEREAATLGVEQRFPFLDRRVGEFCLRLPRDQRERGRFWKWVLISAMRGQLPDRVLDRVVQAEFSQLFEAVFYSAPAQQRMQNLISVRKTDWLDPRRFAQRIHLAADPAETESSTYLPAWKVLAADLWLETLPNFAAAPDGWLP